MKLKVCFYLLWILRSSLTNRVLLYTKDISQKHYRVTSGVPLDIILWNIFYNGVLGQALPHGFKTVGLADDLEIVTTARFKTEIELNTNILRGLSTNG